MKKIILFLIILLTQTTNIPAENEIKKITVGNNDAKITIIAYESLTCSHCADLQIKVYQELKREYIDTGIAKIEES